MNRNYDNFFKTKQGTFTQSTLNFLNVPHFDFGSNTPPQKNVDGDNSKCTFHTS